MIDAIERTLDGFEKGTVTRREAVARLGALVAVLSGIRGAAAADPAADSPTFETVGLNHIALDVTDVALWEKLFAINLRAPFFLSQAFASNLAGSREGAIVNIADARTRQPGTDHFAYRLTKGGLSQMTEMLAAELAPAVRVNAVALGAILPPPGQGEDYLRDYADRRVPLGHPGGLTTVTANVLHLLRQPFLTGAVVPLDGGEFL